MGSDPIGKDELQGMMRRWLYDFPLEKVIILAKISEPCFSISYVISKQAQTRSRK